MYMYVARPGLLTYESGALPTALRCPAIQHAYLETDSFANVATENNCGWLVGWFWL